MQPNKTLKIIWQLLLAFSIVVTLFAFWLVLAGYEGVKAVADQAAPDGSLERFTLPVYRFLKILSLVAGPLLAVLLLAARKWALAAILGLLTWLAKIRFLPAHTRQFTGDIRHQFSSRADNLAIVVLVLTGAAARFILSSTPMGHDESYTFVEFASKGLYSIITDYHLPNNHVFHSILVALSTSLFGSAPWVVRLPAIMTSLTLIPTGYLAGKSYFSRKVGLLLAAAFAILPHFIYTALNARGYILVALFTMLVLGLVNYIKRRRNMLAWWLLVLVSVLGFFTLPTMLYPFGAALLWLLLAWLLKNVHPENRTSGFFWSIFLTGLFVSIITICLYLPIVMNNGLDMLIAPPPVMTLKVNSLRLLAEDASVRLGTAWQTWHKGLPQAARWVSLAGLGWAFIRYRKLSVHNRISFFLILAAWTALVVTAQMTVGWVRIWLFLSPLYFLYALAGLLDLFEFVLQKVVKTPPRWLAGSIAACALIFMSAAWWFSQSDYQDLLAGEKGYNELAAEFLVENTGSEDFIIVDSHDAPVLWYYTGIKGMSIERFRGIRETEINDTIVIVNTGAGQSIDTLLDYTPEEVELIYESPPLEIYRTH